MINIFKSPTATPIREFLTLYNEGELDLEADYQRDFVWSIENQIELIRSFVDGYPIGGFSVIRRTYKDVYCEAVDGKQRLTTFFRFFNNEIPYIDEEGNSTLFADMSLPRQRGILMQTVPVSGLDVQRPQDEPTRLEILTFFYRINFGGVPQTEEHKQKIAAEIELLKAA